MAKDADYVRLRSDRPIWWTKVEWHVIDNHHQVEHLGPTLASADGRHVMLSRNYRPTPELVVTLESPDLPGITDVRAP